MDRIVLKFTTQRRYDVAPECPCGKSNKDNKFVPFKGYTDKGYCFSCHKTFLPEGEYPQQFTMPKEQPEGRIIDFEVLSRTIHFAMTTPFYKWLLGLFDQKRIDEVIRKYMVGGTDKGDIIFPGIDKYGNLRFLKVVRFGEDGHKILMYALKPYTSENGYYPCLLGEHLLKGHSGPVYVVESEKTAIVCRIFCPDKIFLATLGANSMTPRKIKALQGHKVVIITDADQSGRDGAKRTREKLKQGGIVSIIHDPFPEREDGYDLADHFAENYRKLRNDI